MAFNGGQGGRSGSDEVIDQNQGARRIFSLAAGLVLAAPGCGAALPSGRVPIQFRGSEPPIRAVVPILPEVIWGPGGGSFNELLCGIGGSQKRAAFGIGRRGDTSPLGGLLCSTARIPRGNLLKSRNMKSEMRLAARFFRYRRVTC